MGDNENARPGDDDQGGRQRGWRATTSVRARWRVSQQRHHRQVAKAFDAWAVDHYGPDAARAAGIPAPATESGCSCCCHATDAGDAWRDMGFHLGVPERRAAGLALLERERAA